MTTPVRLSGLQRDVLALYRRVLRAAAKKDRENRNAAVKFSALLSQSNGDDASSTCYAAAEFRRQAATVKRSDFKKIEYLIRKGDKQVKLLNMPGVNVVRGTG